jgi:2-hydroxyglutarate dehydrogenase
VGAGIIGLAVARELALRHDGMRIVVLEREPELGRHQTGNTSGVIHAGVYYEPGSLKARLCVEGAHELYTYCAEHGIRAERSGKLIVATSEEELPRLDELERRGRGNGVPGLRRLSGGEVCEVEPHTAGIAALHSPATGIVDFAEVARSFGDDVTAGGGTVALGSPLIAMTEHGDRARVRHAHGITEARAAILCAGAWSDRLAVAAGADPEPRIVPFRGTYLRLRPERRELVRGSVYPVPDPSLPFLGAHLTRGIDGEVLLGPTALLSPSLHSLGWPGTWRLMQRHRRAGLTEIRHAASRRSLAREAAHLVPELGARDLERAFTGIRAQAVARDGTLVDDFVFSRTGRALHVRNAPSPAATASLAIARHIADRAELELAVGE